VPAFIYITAPGGHAQRTSFSGNTEWLLLSRKRNIVEEMYKPPDVEIYLNQEFYSSGKDAITRSRFM
jgi:hypothetical protein